MSAASLVPLIGPPKWKRQFASSDIKPEVLISVVDDPSSESSDHNDVESKTTTPKNMMCLSTSSSTNTPDILCPTCEKNVSRYSCPRCSAPYCSLECYKRHDVWNQSQDGGGFETKGGVEVSGGQCTEAFYRGRVVSVNQLDIKTEENKIKMRNILARAKDEKLPEGNEDSERIVEAADAGKDTDLTEDEWDQLAQHVMQMDVHCEEQNETLDHQNDASDEDVNDLFLASLPMAVKEKFEIALQKGHLSPLIQEWHPFWIPKYVDHISGNNHQNNESQRIEYMYDHDSTISPDMVRTIDERILNLPQIVPAISSPEPRVNLYPNTLEILFVAARTLRLYNGIESVGKKTKLLLQDDSIQEASIHFYTQCHVLSKDARWNSTKEVLMHLQCTDTLQRPMLLQHFGNAMDSKTTLFIGLNDVILIGAHRRLVLRVLFRILDMINVGRKAMSEMKSPKRPVDQEQKVLIKKLKLAQKKVEFFCSWVNLYWDINKDNILEELNGWIDRYVQSEKECQGNDSSPI